MCGGDAACCQITLTACFILLLQYIVVGYNRPHLGSAAIWPNNTKDRLTEIHSIFGIM